MYSTKNVGKYFSEKMFNLNGHCPHVVHKNVVHFCCIRFIYFGLGNASKLQTSYIVSVLVTFY